MIARLLVGLCVIASPAQAQVFWDQPNVASAADAQGLSYKIYITAPGATSPSTLTLAAVTCTVSGTTLPLTAACQAPAAQVVALGATAPGASSQLTAANTLGESPKSSPPFMVPGCTDPTNVSLVVGSWARTLSVGGVGQVLYSLRQSKTAITTISVLFNGVEQGHLDGARLNDVAGSYFTATVPAGTYQLTVQAADVNGCLAGGAARPMTVVVQ